MKYFRIFNHTSDYIDYMAQEDAVVPNISYCSGDSGTYITASKTPTGCTLVIEGASEITAETCGCNAMCGDNIITFTAHTFSSGDIVTVESGNVSDTFTFE